VKEKLSTYDKTKKTVGADQKTKMEKKKIRGRNGKERTGRKPIFLY